MPAITDWLMVAITAVYVIATIFICHANIISAKATREQVAESKRQFEETRRLEIMPYLQFESYSGDSPTEYNLQLALVSGDLGATRCAVKYSVKNIGRGTAKDITWVWHWFNGSYDKKDFPIRALQSGDKHSLKITFATPKGKSDVTIASIELRFRDLLNNTYTQTIQFEFEYFRDVLTLKGYNMTAPEPRKDLGKDAAYV